MSDVAVDSVITFASEDWEQELSGSEEEDWKEALRESLTVESPSDPSFLVISSVDARDDNALAELNEC